ncbi:hypothetical protein GA0070606_0334 [Micromonospora citrea]|uniref:Uncharacterized protein n=1 Tax=Micromonospora citrea TaxID=47855 RepID=A0A1C6TSC9_9ACTN|nr:hypothetical protein [Micromonospora citrea]SCL44531.1 hypothetical protein GA0070606_0334 [Micromonospora citrea]
MDQVRRAVVFADHAQFYIQDVDGQVAAEEDDDHDWPEAWSEEAVEVWRIGPDGPCSIAIGTARSDHVETALQVHLADPPLSADAEHIVEADLAVPSGVVHVFGCMEVPGPQHRVDIPAGRYRLRISYLPSGPPPAPTLPYAIEPGPHFRHHLDLWPCAQGKGVAVIRRGRPA